jgi:hypothetical protein
MEILMATAAVTLAGCYDPTLRDCTVSCSVAGDCIGGQICGADHLCASADLAGRCDQTATVDARPASDAAIDAGLSVQLHVRVDGSGSVVLDGGGSCTKDCMLPAPLGQPATLRAVQTDRKFVFAEWTSLACAGQGASCMLTPIVPTDVHAKFVKQD